MLVFIQELRRFFLAAIEEVVRIFGVEWPNINTVSTSAACLTSCHYIIYMYIVARRRQFLMVASCEQEDLPLKKRKTASRGSGNGFSNEK